MKQAAKKLRWFWTSDGGGGIIVSASSPSKAKIAFGRDISGNYTAFESLKHIRATLVKETLAREPEKE